MTTSSDQPDGRFFAPREDAESAGESDADSVGTNAMRALMVGLLLGDAQDAMYGLESEFRRVGVPEGIPPLQGWEDRLDAASRSDAYLRQYDIAEPGTARPSDGRPFASQRVALWQAVQEAPSDPAFAVAWLRAVMAAGPETPDGTAAAAALSHWRRPKGMTLEQAPQFMVSARDLLRDASEGNDPTAREIALAARGSGVGVARQSNAEDSEVKRWRVPRSAGDLSTMVHGTWAWRGQWWYPGGDFHAFVHQGVRPNLYSGGAPFSWSGAYLRRSRQVAAERLARWVEDVADNRTDTVFAHSYGGGITLMSTPLGACYETAVLLSTPVHQNYDVEWRNIARPLSLRLGFDLVLAAARARQRFGANVDELVLDLQPWRHGATHDPALWDDEGIAGMLGL